jgi:hypothetical protein
MVGGAYSHHGQQQYTAAAARPQAFYPQAKGGYPDMHKKLGGIYPQPDYE